jgi:hypothetical protein
MPAFRAVVGASDHYGRAELVTLGMRSGKPFLLDRRRVALIEAGLPGAPYHHEALEMELDQARELVDRVRRSVAEHARAGLSALRAEFSVGAIGVAASPYERVPEALEDVLSSRPLTNAADGMMYREALAQAAQELGLDVTRYPRKADPMDLAAEAWKVDRTEIESLVAAFGREAGPPWRQDQKTAAAVALSLIGRPSLRTRGLLPSSVSVYAPDGDIGSGRA